MKIALVTNFLYPEGIGGTEIYCFQLAQALVECGLEVFWFVPNFRSSLTDTEVRGNGINVVKFAAIDSEGKSNLVFTCKSFTNEMFIRGIAVAHFHEFGGDDGISTELLKDSKRAGIRTVVTFHLANYICKTGTMYYAGVVPCNGKMILSRCSSCSIFSGKTRQPLLNLAMAKIADQVLKTGMLNNIPRIKNYLNGIDLKTTFIETISDYADVVVSLTHWFRNVLLVNGIDKTKTAYIAQVSPVLDHSLTPAGKTERRGIVFIGRVDKQKGIDLILAIADKLKVEFPGLVIDIYGPSYGPYQPDNRIQNQPYPDMDKYDNIRYKGVLDPGMVLNVMNQYKAVLLPSLVAEMAPLIIMEANSLKVPVIVSDVPGSVELTRQYDCGLVFKYASPDDLLKKIKEIEEGNINFEFRQPAENNFISVARQYQRIYNGNSKILENEQ